ncbi:hypothetical protein [Amycolatopsis sp. CA-230715]|uniref:hypothetical protein n=1 Tax=Amycolatopsis sp. CA-230715 TaxID=2745196 RepID=UPI001C031F37|nr:hypothetical protein [Amycolatopsis sp. CA-230715]QWF77718.1 hypothetical protein HUW46_01110 [Amycolatopsis sp. CA-230715]
MTNPNWPGQQGHQGPRGPQYPQQQWQQPPGHQQWPQQPYPYQQRPQFPPKPPRRRGPIIGIAVAAVVVIAATTVTLVLTLGGDKDGGGQQAAGPGEGGSEYTAPADGSGYDTADWDQPLPLPLGENRCAWQKDAVPEIGALGGGVTDFKDNTSGCQFLLADGNTIVQVRETGPYNRISQDTSVLEPAQFAGVPGRVYAFTYEKHTGCSALLASRSAAVPAVDISTKDKGGDQKQHCELAKKAMEVVANKYVPLAGGTPASGTVQEVPANALQGKNACDLAKAGASYIGVESKSAQEGTDPLGSTCKLDGSDTTASAKLTTSTALDAVPPVPGAKATNGKLGTYPLRMEQEPAKCTLSLDLGGGKVFQLAMGPKDGQPVNITCQAGRVALANGLVNLLQEASYQ